MTTTGDLPSDLVEMYFKRVARQCAREHEDWSLLDIAMSEYSYLKHDGPMYGPADGYVASYREEVRAGRRGDKNGYNCLPWPCIELEDMRMVYDTKSNCFMSVEVTYNKSGHRAIYGIRKSDGRAILWAD